MSPDEYQAPIKAKSLSFDISRFSIEEQKEHKFEHWVNKTAKLIDRPYFRTFKMVEKWPIEKIIERYQTATKHHGSISPSYKWWAERRKDLDDK